VELKLKQSDLVNLLVNRCKEQGNWKDGTYDKADPTHFESGKASYYVGDALVTVDYPPYEDREPELLEVEFNDCTWGFEFRFNLVCAGGTEQKSSGYFDSEGGSWHRIEGEFERDFRNAMISKPWKEPGGWGGRVRT